MQVFKDSRDRCIWANAYFVRVGEKLVENSPSASKRSAFEGGKFETILNSRNRVTDRGGELKAQSNRNNRAAVNWPRFFVLARCLSPLEICMSAARNLFEI